MKSVSGERESKREGILILSVAKDPLRVVRWLAG
jgi:hypothetical protein